MYSLHIICFFRFSPWQFLSCYCTGVKFLQWASHFLCSLALHNMDIMRLLKTTRDLSQVDFNGEESVVGVCRLIETEGTHQRNAACTVPSGSEVFLNSSLSIDSAVYDNKAQNCTLTSAGLSLAKHPWGSRVHWLLKKHPNTFVKSNMINVLQKQSKKAIPPYVSCRWACNQRYSFVETCCSCSKLCHVVQTRFSCIFLFYLRIKTAAEHLDMSIYIG